MGATTQYLVEVDYRLRGVEDSIRKLDAAGTHAQKTEKSFLSLRNVFLGAFAYRGIGLIKSGLIDTNAEMQNLQIGMSAVIAMNIGKPFKDAQPYAAALIKDFREFAKAAPGTTTDYIKFSQQVIGAVTANGGSLRDVAELSKGGVVASLALGQNPEVASRDIMQAAMGQHISASRDKFAAMLIQPYMQLDKFNKMKVPERIAFLKKALTSPAIKDATKAYGDSWEGVTSTLKDHWQNTLRQVGTPLFQKLTQRLKELNAWIEAHPAKIKAIADAIGSGLVKAADALFSVGKFFVEHRQLLMQLAEAFLVFKGSQLIAGGIGSLIGGFKNLGGILSGPTGVIGAMALLGASLWALKGKLDMLRGDDEYAKGTRFAMGTVLGFDPVNMVDSLHEMADPGFAAREARRKLLNKTFGRLKLHEVTGDADALGLKSNRKIPANDGKVNITIKKVEVVADDSDNFVHDLVGAVGREITSPAQGLNMPRSVW